MSAWLYRNDDHLFALVADRAGSRLPAELGPWTYLKQVELTGRDADEAQAIALMLEHGYCCFE